MSSEDSSDETIPNQTPFNVGDIVYEPGFNHLGKIKKIGYGSVVYTIITGNKAGQDFMSAECYGLRLATERDKISCQSVQ